MSDLSQTYSEIKAFDHEPSELLQNFCYKIVFTPKKRFS